MNAAPGGRGRLAPAGERNCVLCVRSLENVHKQLTGDKSASSAPSPLFFS